MSFTVDGLEWPVKTRIDRIVELKESEVSGYMMDHSYNRDPLGKWLSYDIAIVCPFGMEDQYKRLHAVLSDPVDGHSFVLPYDDTTVTITARVERLKDTLYQNPEGGNCWQGLQMTVISNHPLAVYSLGQLLTRGRAPMPELGAGVIGDSWSYTSNGWEHAHYNVADDVYY